MASFFDTMVAAQMASGGQNVITPDNLQRIMGLAAQQEAQRRLALASGQQAVAEKKAEQALLGTRDGTLASEGRFITAPSGARFVTDAQGNVVGSSTAALPAEAGKAMLRGEATMAEQAQLGPAIRSSFIQEMQKAAPSSPRQAAAPAAPAPTPMVLASSARQAPETITETVATETETLPAGPAVPLSELMRETQRMRETKVGEEPIATPQQKELMKTVASKRRELGKLLPLLEQAVRRNDLKKAEEVQSEISKIRSDMLMAREQAYPGSLGAAQRKATERKLEVGGFGVPGM